MGNFLFFTRSDSGLGNLKLCNLVEEPASPFASAYSQGVLGSGLNPNIGVQNQVSTLLRGLVAAIL
jgi:hypothetical protein